MEFVDGAPLADYATAHDLDTAARLQLFMLLCGAMQYAHQNLVINRDIKPANVLVTVCRTPGLRHCQAAQCRADGSDPGGRDPPGSAADDAGIREPGTGARRAGDNGHRHLFTRHPAVRAADRAYAVPHHQPGRTGNRPRGVRVGAAPPEPGRDAAAGVSCAHHRRNDRRRRRASARPPPGRPAGRPRARGRRTTPRRCRSSKLSRRPARSTAPTGRHSRRRAASWARYRRDAEGAPDQLAACVGANRTRTYPATCPTTTV
jgi:hypothetical protein